MCTAKHNLISGGKNPFMIGARQRYESFIGFYSLLYLFIYLGFYVAFNTVQVISRWVVGRAEETGT